MPEGQLPDPGLSLERVETPNQRSIEDVSSFFKVGSDKCLKTLIVRGENNTLAALLLRGDHELNPIKAEKIEGISSPLQMAGDEEIWPPAVAGPVPSAHRACHPYYRRPQRNADGRFYLRRQPGRAGTIQGVNWRRDLALPERIADLRMVQEGDPSPDGKGRITIARGIEVGIFSS